MSETERLILVLEALRVALHLSQEELEELLGVSPGTVAGWGFLLVRHEVASRE